MPMTGSEIKSLAKCYSIAAIPDHVGIRIEQLCCARVMEIVVSIRPGRTEARAITEEDM